MGKRDDTQDEPYGEDERARERRRRRREFRQRKHDGLDRLALKLTEIEDRAAGSPGPPDGEAEALGTSAKALRKKKKRVRARLDELAAVPEESWGESLEEFEEGWLELEEDWEALARRVTKRGWRLPE